MNKKYTALKELSSGERDKRIENLRMDIIKGKVTASKGGKVKMRELKKTLARLLMLQSEKVEDKK